MRKILLILLVIIFVTPAYSEDDDSTPYMPYAEQPKQSTTTKKATPKKKAPAKKATPKKSTTKSAKKTKAPAAPRITSLQRGIDLLNEGKYDAAKQYLLKAIQENRNDPNVWYWYGVYSERTGGFHQAQYFYSKAITIDPAFEPLSRVVYYPNDAEKTPLWDPKRPARVYPVATSSNGVTVSSRNNYPSSPYDPSLPKVPVYTPPEPGSYPEDGDAWAPGIYVPPTPDEITAANNARYVMEVPVSSTSTLTRESITVERDPVRADLPLYEPPDPSVKVSAAPTRSTPKEAVKSTSTSSKSSTTTKAPAAPRKVVKASDKKKSTTKSTSTKAKSTPKTPTSSDVRPSATTRRRETPMPIVPDTRTTTEEHETEKRTAEYLPPVGQFAPDPGTINTDEPMIPPVSN